MLGGVPVTDSKKGVMIPEPLPAWLTSTVFDRFKQFGLVFGEDSTKLDMPNHVLVNEYLSGQGILVNCN